MTARRGLHPASEVLFEHNDSKWPKELRGAQHWDGAVEVRPVKVMMAQETCDLERKAVAMMSRG